MTKRRVRQIIESEGLAGSRCRTKSLRQLPEYNWQPRWQRTVRIFFNSEMPFPVYIGANDIFSRVHTDLSLSFEKFLLKGVKIYIPPNMKIDWKFWEPMPEPNFV